MYQKSRLEKTGRLYFLSKIDLHRVIRINEIGFFAV